MNMEREYIDYHLFSEWDFWWIHGTMDDGLIGFGFLSDGMYNVSGCLPERSGSCTDIIEPACLMDYLDRVI